jgi:hypothetical protein
MLLEVLIGVRFRTEYHTQASEISCALNERKSAINSTKKNQLPFNL